MTDKIHCDLCNVDVSRSGFSHHKLTKKHSIEEAKKYGKYDFITHTIITSEKIDLHDNPNITPEIIINKKRIFTNKPDIKINLKELKELMKPSDIPKLSITKKINICH